MLTGKPADGVDFDAVAKKTDHFSGADMTVSGPWPAYNFIGAEVGA